MFGRRRGAAVPPVPPWQGGALRAGVQLLPLGRRDVPTVVLSLDGLQVQVPAGEVRALVQGRTGVAESSGSPVSFLCRPGAAAPGSAVHEVVGGLPGEALALVVDDGRPRLAAVLDGPVLESFTGWARALPG